MRSTNDKLPDLEDALRAYLEGAHRGKEQAIKRAELVDIFEDWLVGSRATRDRALRKVKEHLVVKHGCPIGSCPTGYFWAVTPEEIEEVCAYYKNYALSSLLVVSRLKKIPMSHVCGQLTFEVMNEK